MNKIVYDRLKEICPDKNVMDMPISEVEEDCHIAFEIIGYKPENLGRAVEEIYTNYDIEPLYEFIFKVWEEDK